MSIASQLSSFWLYEAEIVAIRPNGNLVVASKLLDESQRQEISPIFYGGNYDSGLFQSPNVGDRVLCGRVHPGRSGITQAIKLIPVANKEISTREIPAADDLPAASSSYPIRNLKPGDVRLVGYGGGEVSLTGTATSGRVFIGNVFKSGIHINTEGTESVVSTMGHSIQNVSDGGKVYVGPVIRTPQNSNIRTSQNRIRHDLAAYSSNTDGIQRGIWNKIKANEIYINSNIRNPSISEYRMVVNEISEKAAYQGFDLENQKAQNRVKQQFSSDKELRFLDPRNTLYLGPHQLVEVLAGNIVSYRGDVLDLNYGVIVLGNAGAPNLSGIKEINYEQDRLKSRRGIGYHFQLSTNSKSESINNSNQNLIFSADKEGTLKINIPRNNNSGNIPYPTSAKFYTKSGGVFSKPLYPSKTEKIPVTLRSKDNKVVFPSAFTAESEFEGNKESLTRSTGVRFSNHDSYFNNFGESLQEEVRVNFTGHHNMYAAAEMLIANTINKVNIPFNNVDTTYIVRGIQGDSPFELPIKSPNDDGTLCDEIKYMSTVGVSPSAPAIDPGGKTVVAGTSYLETVDDNGELINYPYSNSFAVTNNDGELVAVNVDDKSNPQKAPGGKSANINFEGAIDVSVGKDNYDSKSIVLDTAGSLIAWFGKDRNNRSMIVQTDGDVLLNIGGTNGDSFNKGRFDLRVNVTNKGFLGDDSVGTANNTISDTPDGGPMASDYIISISENGLVIAGMNPGTPMIIRNDGDFMLESTSKLILSGTKVVVRNGGEAEREIFKDPVSGDTVDASINTADKAIQRIDKIINPDSSKC